MHLSYLNIIISYYCKCFCFSVDNSSEPFDYHHTYTNVCGLFAPELPTDPFDTSIFDTASHIINNISSTSKISNSQTNELVLVNTSKLDMTFIAELEKNLGKKEAQANTNKQVVLAPPNVVPKKLNTEHLNSAIPRPSSSINNLTNGASSVYYSTTDLDLSAFVSKYDSDPIYAANLNATENKVKELCISNIQSNKSFNTSSNSKFKTDNITVASNNSSPYYSPPVNVSRYYSQTPSMYQIVPEPNAVLNYFKIFYIMVTALLPVKPKIMYIVFSQFLTNSICIS